MERKYEPIVGPVCLNNRSAAYVETGNGGFVRFENSHWISNYKLSVGTDGLHFMVEETETEKLTDKLYESEDGAKGIMSEIPTAEFDNSVYVYNPKTEKYVGTQIFKDDDGHYVTDELLVIDDKCDGKACKKSLRIPNGVYEYKKFKDGYSGHVVLEANVYSDEKHASWYEQAKVDGKRETPRAELLKIPEEVLSELKARMTALTDYAKENNIKLFFYSGSCGIEAVKQPEGYETSIDCEGDNLIPQELLYNIGYLDSDYPECSDYNPCLRKKVGEND